MTQVLQRGANISLSQIIPSNNKISIVLTPYAKWGDKPALLMIL